MREPRRAPPEKFNEANSGNGVQAGCGALVGLLLPLGGIYWFRRSLFSTPGILAIVCVVSAIVCGFAAYKLGDRFWENPPWRR